MVRAFGQSFAGSVDSYEIACGPVSDVSQENQGEGQLLHDENNAQSEDQVDECS